MIRIRKFLIKAGRFVLPLLILVAGVGTLLVFGKRPEVPRRDASGDRSPVVETVEVISFEDMLPLEVEGVAIPYRTVRLSAEVDGRITEKSPDARAGSYVRKDDFLLQIDTADYDLEVARLKSEVRQAEEDIRAVEIDVASTRSLIELAGQELALRKAELARRERVYAKKVITDSELDEARRLKLVSQNALQTLQNALASYQQRTQTLGAAQDRANVRLQRALLDQKRTRVTSPLTGTIISDFVEEDDFVKRGDPLLLLNDTSRVEIKCSLRMDQLCWLWLQAGIGRPGEQTSPESLFELPTSPVQVIYRLHGTDYMWNGLMSHYEGMGLDEKTRMVPCRIRVDEPTRVRRSESGQSSERDVSPPSLLSGMYVTVRVPVKPPVSLLSVPAAAVRPGGRVWVVRDGALQIETVDVILARKESDIIRQSARGGLRAGDRVIISPLPHTTAGMPVTEVAAR
ncbi:MAG: efflux RND transporter periplasmic adaptor subunit [Pirellulales bacterium]